MQEKEQKTYYYMEAANGMTVRVPEDKLDSWKKAQDEIRAGKKPEIDPETRKRLHSLLGLK